MFGDWLLCDFHIHTQYSDGAVSLDDTVDLYGSHGFDVIAITDHILDSCTRARAAERGSRLCVTPQNYADYLAAVRDVRQRAWEQHRMLVLPGFEVTNDRRKFHLLGIDIETCPDPDLSVPDQLDWVHAQGGIGVACHPHHRSQTDEQQSRHLWQNHERYATLFDAWEVANRDDLFSAVGLKKYNYIANGDFHQPRHLYSWKTLLRCDKSPEAVKQAVRDNRRVAIYLFRPEA